MTIPLERQIQEIERELTERSHDYGYRVSMGTMTGAEASHRIRVMKAVLGTLKWLHRREETIRGVIGTAVGEEREAGRSPALAVHENEEGR